MNKITLFIFLFFSFLTVGIAQENTSEPKKGIKVFPQSRQRTTPSTPNQIFDQEFQLTAENEFRLMENTTDNSGFTHNAYQQYYNDIKVEFGQASLHNKDGNLLSMSYNIYELSSLNVGSSLSSSEALNRAISFVGASKYLWEDEEQAALVNSYTRPYGELVVLPNLNDPETSATIAYKFDIYALEPLYRADVYVDANTGYVLLENQTMHEADTPATGESLYNGVVSFTADDALGNFRLRQTANGGGINTFDLNNGTNYATATDITSDTNIFSAETATGVQAHWGAENTYNYFQQKHGRNSYDNAGSPLNSYVSYGVNYVNAFWDGSRMTYGDGDGVNYGPLVPLDIVGHEISHGVTQNSSNLLYQKESGALNESFSDIFGEAIENFASGANDWLTGDEIGIGGSNGAFRSISNPNQFGDPDTYGGSFWIDPNCSPSQFNDYCGVHTNSGVQNYWFYLLSVGGSGTNDIGNGFAVQAIGMEKAAAIAYRNLTVYLSPTSTFNDARLGAIQSAVDLYGLNSPEEVAVTNAWHAVGVGEKFVEPNSIKSVILVDANSDEDIFEVTEGMEFNLATLPSSLLDIRANVSLEVESIGFELSGSQNFSGSDNEEPYALFGDSPSGDYIGNTFETGSYTLIVTPFKGDDLTGEEGNSLTVNFTVLNIDTERPTISCSNDITVVLDNAVCDSTIPVDEPTAIDNVSTVFTIVGIRSDGKELSEPFNVGKTYIEWLAIDEAGNESDHCIQTVTLQDQSSITIVCPDDIVLLNDEGQEGAIVTFELPDVTGSCTDLPGISTAEYIVNGSFETGDLFGWTITQEGSGTVVINDGTFDPAGPSEAIAPIAKNYDVMFTQTGPTKQLISRPFVVPSIVNNAELSWKDRIRNHATSFSDPNQEFRVELLDANLNVITQIFSTNPGDERIQIGPNNRLFDLTSVLQGHVGEQVCIKFIEEDNLGYFNANLDDISLEITGNNAASVSQVTQTAGLLSGSLFPLGTTTNTFEVAGSNGLTTCSFDVTVNPDPNKTFVTTWKTDNPGVSGDNQIFIEAFGAIYDYYIDWGDGTSNTNVTEDITHTYASSGIYTVSISGVFPKIHFTDDGTSDEKKLLYIDQWGDQKWKSMLFIGCSNLDIVAQDVPDLSDMTTLSNTFVGCGSLVANEFFGQWDVSNITTMPTTFSGASNFNVDISNWDVSNVTFMTGMFWGASSFNQNISNWDVGQVTRMKSMFNGATSFNQNLGGWNIDNVIDVQDMFNNARLSVENYDQTLIGWSSNPATGFGLIFDGGNSQYCQGEEARQKLIDDFGWTITDGGKSADCPEPNDFTLRINAGGAEVDFNGETFLTDIYFNMGSTLDRPQTGLPEPYQTFRFSRSQEMSYNIPLEDGEYTVNLYFAELWFGATGGGSGGVGSRVFDVSIEGELAEDNLDVFAEAGPDAMVMKSHEVTVTGGVLNIDFDSRDIVGGERHPIINAIEILGQGSELEDQSFVTTWKTDNPGISNDNQITIPTYSGEVYNYTVDWGDGSANIGITGDITHTYAISGIYEVSISGDFPGIYFGATSDNDRKKIILVKQWGNTIWSKFDSAFNGCENLDVVATDTPDFSQVTSAAGMFISCQSLVGNSSFGDWDVSTIQDMSYMFYSANLFNRDIGGWNVSGVTDMHDMFNLASSFNQNIGNWNVGAVTDMDSMFQNATAFNANIGSWNVSSVEKMIDMFLGASSFNQDIGLWNVTNVRFMADMFRGATAFNQNIGSWEVGNVITMPSMFSGASSFNQDIGAWDVQKVQFTSNMFAGATAFDQDLGDWNLKSVTSAINMFSGVTLSTENYDSLLNGWSAQQLQNGVTFNAGNSQYCQGEEARQKLIDDFGWTITDGGKTADCPDTTSFITTWKTDNPGISDDNQIMIPTFPGETYNYSVDWGDGIVTSGEIGDATHTYSNPGTYQVSISGDFPRIHLGGAGLLTDKEKLLSVDQWGDIKWNSMVSAFENCINFDLKAIDTPDLTLVNSLDRMFIGCTSLMGNENINDWDVSSIRSMNGLFALSPNFNQPIGNWDVSGVESMNSVFSRATSFNQPLSDWDVSSVKSMAFTFDQATSFNQPIDNWDVSQVDNMWGMFLEATNFNQPLNNWNVGNVGDMTGMFLNASSFNQDIGDWNVSKVTYFYNMFDGTQFNHSLARWRPLNVTNMENMFDNSSLSNENYDTTLIGWGNLSSLPTNVQLGAKDNEYCLSEAARQRLIDDFGWTITDAGKSADCPDPSDFALRINTGGTETTYDDNIFVTDTYFNTGNTLDRPQTGLPEPYQTFRFSRSQQMSYDIPLEDGEYTVNLYFAELWFGATGGGSGGAGSRVFDVSIEGELAEDNLDVFAEAGADAMLMKSHTVTVTGGVLDIDFDSRDAVGGARHPIINAIEILGQVSEPEERPFVTTWKTDNPGASEDNQITIPTHPDETYNYTVDWGDGTSNLSVTGGITHTYATSGTYQVSISGDFPSIYFYNDMSDRLKIVSVDQWGEISWKSFRYAFWACFNMDVLATDLPNLLNVDVTTGMFSSCESMVGNSSFEDWDVSNVTAMEYMFSNTPFNQDISNWDVGNVVYMDGMFQSSMFNQDISDWKMNRVSRLPFMFKNSLFNQPIGTWDLRNAGIMTSMFEGAVHFDQELGNWNVSSVSKMEEMFNNAGISQMNYDNTLIGWSSQQLRNDVIFDGGSSQFCQGEAARQKLIDDFGWTITDAGKAADCQDTTAFITTWKTDNPGVSEDNQITIPTFPEATYNYSVDWGDGASDSGVTEDMTHTYTTPGTYQVAISGDFPRIYFNNEGDKDKLIFVEQWGDNEWASMESAFEGCVNLDVTASDVPNFSMANSTGNMFRLCSSLMGTEAFETWNMGNITSAYNMFEDGILFNQDIRNWDVSQIQSMTGMFSGASSFNQDIGNWNVGNATSMFTMFRGATSFNQDIGNWDVRRVEVMIAMFQQASAFDQNLNNWDVGNVTSMIGMFDAASSFNQPLNNWNVENVTNMFGMFADAVAFNQPLDNWSVTSVEDMTNLFLRATGFDQDLGNWDVGQVIRMIDMFKDAGLSQDNYDSTLIGWSNLSSLQNGVVFDAGTSQYCLGESARQKLIDDFSWTISDGGKASDCIDPNAFITTWKSDNPGRNNNEIMISTFPGEVYNFTVDWGDGNINSGVTNTIFHTYDTPGIYTVSITGQFPRVLLNSLFYRERLISIDQWGSSTWSSMELAFEGCSNLDVLANDLPDLSNVTSMASMFNECTNLKGNNVFTQWDLSNVSNISSMFSKTGFNQPIGSWNVSNVTDMRNVFNESSFNQDIGNWNVSKVSEFGGMFRRSPFNQDISSWNVSQAKGMSFMFYGTTAFNQDISNWNTQNTTNFYYMFGEANSFDQNIGNWDVANVTIMSNMFIGTALSDTNYDKLLEGWSTQQLQNGVTFDGGNSQYCLGEEARQKLIDDFGWTITDAGKSTDCPEPSDFALRINAGGTEVDYNGEIFITDTYFNTGTTLDRPQTGLPEPFQTFRFSRSQQMSYDIPLEDGEYTVNLYFAELWFGATGGGSGGVGSRVFDVNIEGELAEDNLDVFAEAGADAMLMKSHTVTVTGGVLDIDFDSRDAVDGVRHPIINAIEILGQGTSTFPPIADAGSDVIIELPTNSAAFNGSGNDPDGGAISNYLWTQESGPTTATLSGETSMNLLASDLSEGTYVFRLTVTDDENETGFDDVSVIVNSEVMENPEEFWLEAECANVGGNWSVINSANASGGQYLLPPAGTNYNVAPSDPNSTVTFNIDAEAGNYKIYARVSVPSEEDDSFWVRVNGESWLRWNLIPGSADFSWHQVHDRELNTAFLTFDLVDGSNTIEIAHREDGAGLDKLYVTRTSDVPTGLGETDDSCSSGISGKRAIVDTNNATLTPNPVVITTTLSFEKPVQLKTIQVFDVTGRLVHTYNGMEVADDGAYLLNVNELPAGTYFINSVDVKGIKHQKQMVIKK